MWQIEKCPWIREYRSSDLVPFVFFSLVPMCTFIKYEASNSSAIQAGEASIEKMAAICTCIYVQNIKFLWSNLWPGGASTDDANNAKNTMTTHYGQSMTA